MRTFLLALRLFVPVLLLVAGLHLVLGVSGEVLLGSKLPAEVVSEPTLNSQNRFYGVSYALYGALLFLCTTDIQRYGPVFKVIMWTSLVAGASRLGSSWSAIAFRDFSFGHGVGVSCLAADLERKGQRRRVSNEQNWQFRPAVPTQV